MRMTMMTTHASTKPMTAQGRPARPSSAATILAQLQGPSSLQALHPMRTRTTTTTHASTKPTTAQGRPARPSSAATILTQLQGPSSLQALHPMRIRTTTTTHASMKPITAQGRPARPSSAVTILTQLQGPSSLQALHPTRTRTTRPTTATTRGPRTHPCRALLHSQPQSHQSQSHEDEDEDEADEADEADDGNDKEDHIPTLAELCYTHNLKVVNLKVPLANEVVFYKVEPEHSPAPGKKCLGDLRRSGTACRQRLTVSRRASCRACRATPPTARRQ
ncbi:uncharacterized protein J3D65DRAFT_310986 [Phyllosticta citribraziliensis]|uniref:Uncharacterized protein n=1 Tax=Phyllosticta citribraziliensis TaxID=989973 RepID=A0ABR1LY39_9PEZI